MPAEDCKVLVIGAGPVGLTLASECARYGVSARVIEKTTQRVPFSKAFGLHARSLECFIAMGVLPLIQKKSSTITKISIVLDPRREVVLDLFSDLEGTRFKCVTVLSQAETEACLEEHLVSHGGKVERGMELVSIQRAQGPEGFLEACIKDLEDGMTQTIICKYIVGCDGAHSATRKLMKLPFRGAAYPEQFLLADVQVASGLTPTTAKMYIGGKRLLAALPLRPGLIRLISKRLHGEESSADPTLEEFEAIARSHIPDIRLCNPEWLASFKIHRRSVPRYREGNVFLAGDAAHIHSPVGGQGLNTGIQDAFNLAWKLALVELKAAHASLLDTYERERHPVGAKVLGVTDYATRVLFTELWIVRFLRNLIVPSILSWGPIRRIVARGAAQLAFDYRRSPIVKNVGWFWAGPRAGDRVPDVAIKSAAGQATTMLDVINRGFKHTLLLFPAADAPASADALEASEAWRTLLAMYGDVMTVVVVASESRAPLTKEDVEVGGHPLEVVVDSGGEARRAFKVGGRPSMYLVRPDGYLAFRARTWEPSALRAYLETIFDRQL